MKAKLEYMGLRVRVCAKVYVHVCVCVYERRERRKRLIPEHSLVRKVAWTEALLQLQNHALLTVSAPYD